MEHAHTVHCRFDTFGVPGRHGMPGLHINHFVLSNLPLETVTWEQMSMAVLHGFAGQYNTNELMLPDWLCYINNSSLWILGHILTSVTVSASRMHMDKASSVLTGERVIVLYGDLQAPACLRQCERRILVIIDVCRNPRFITSVSFIIYSVSHYSKPVWLFGRTQIYIYIYLNYVGT